ncbi:MAG: SAM-dependent methyltransferase [Cyanobacteria bacterium P01_C01_bin.69]
MVEQLSRSRQLQQAIIQTIERSEHGRITFAAFMELALYHPQFSYYATPSSSIGPQGDFITSPHMGHDFGEVISEQFADMWEALGRPEQFDLVEMGAGQGLIAGDAIAHIQTHHPQCFQSLNYIIVEKSAALRAEQQKRLNHWQAQGVSISWKTLENISPNTLTGCAFSNELVDAFPVHLVELHQGHLKEVWVNYAPEKGFTTVLADISIGQLADYFEFVGIDFRSGYAEGYRTEVNLAALDWLAQIERKLKRGYLLTIDYGYTAQRYYSPARKEGTLQCYYQHSHHNDPFIHIGEQDITAHVDFTALEKQGEKLGLEKLGFLQQGLFLMALGLGDRLATLAQPDKAQPATGKDIQAMMHRRDALQQLISPMGLGNFGVLIQGKGLTKAEIARPLKGLTIPPMF